MPLFRASEGILAQKMISLGSTISLYQQVGILPSRGVCRSCSRECREWRRHETWVYWQCTECRGAQGKTGLRANTVLANSNIKLEWFMVLVLLFADRGKTYKQIQNSACLPSDPAYKDNYMSTKTISKWNKFFMHICAKDYMKKGIKLGGDNEEDICEIDETMCGKMKFGKGDPRKRRRQWVFGGVMRKSRQAFMVACPNNKRTKRVLWPIIQANIHYGTTIYSDGWSAYRKLPHLGYPHRWIDHSKHYVAPTDPTLHTNSIEGLWGCWKRWLPSSGPYNLEMYMHTFLWFTNIKASGLDPFWSLVELVKENNSVEVLKEAFQVEEDMEATEDDKVEDAEVAKLDDLYETESETTDGEGDNFNCPFCQKMFLNKVELMEHVEECSGVEDGGMSEEESFRDHCCPYCQESFSSSNDVLEHMEKH